MTKDLSEGNGCVDNREEGEDQEVVVKYHKKLMAIVDSEKQQGRVQGKGLNKKTGIKFCCGCKKDKD